MLENKYTSNICMFFCFVLFLFFGWVFGGFFVGLGFCFTVFCLLLCVFWGVVLCFFFLSTTLLWIDLLYSLDVYNDHWKAMFRKHIVLSVIGFGGNLYHLLPTPKSIKNIPKQIPYFNIFNKH